MPGIAGKHQRAGGKHTGQAERGAAGAVGTARSTPAGRREALATLRSRIQRLQRHYHPRRARCPSGLAALDAAIGGGFSRGCVHELIGSDEAPLRTLALRMAARVLAPAADELRTPTAGETSVSPEAFAGRGAGRVWGVYIDTTADFYPPAAARMGVPLGRLLILRAPRAADALWACEQALRCQTVGIVIAPIRRLEPRQSRRLQLAAEVGGGLGFLLRPDEPGPPTFSATRLRIEPIAPPPAPLQDGDRLAWHLRLTCLKLREGSAGRAVTLTLAATRDAPAAPETDSETQSSRRCGGYS